MGNKRAPDPEPDPGDRRGASRREFLAGAGLTGVAVAAGAWPALAPIAATASGGGALPMTPVGDRAVAAGQFGVELGGSPGGVASAVDGGSAYADVVTEKLGPDGIVHKHIAGVKYEDITVTVGTGMSKGFYDWIKSSFDLKPSRKTGAIVSADFSLKEVSRVGFVNALVTEVGMPALDAASKDAAKMTIKFSPESTKRTLGGTANIKIGGGGSGLQKKWLPANFRLNIPGLDCTRVNKIEAITLKQSVIPGTVGVRGDTTPSPADVVLSNLVVTVPEAHAQTFYTWHEDFVIKGNNGQAQEKNGTLDYLGADLKTTLFTLKFSNLGIFKLSPEKVEAGSESIRRVKAEMYCERISFDYGPTTAA